LVKAYEHSTIIKKSRKIQHPDKFTAEMATSTTNESGLCCVGGNLFSRDITDDEPRTNVASL